MLRTKNARIATGATKPRPKLADVPTGRYALDPTEPGQTVFYRVDRSATGFVAVVQQIGDAETTVRWALVPAVLDRIAAAGVEAATIRYGLEIGDCGRCGRRLTNEASRRAGIGPICAAKGW
jgi:hypothetical protein